MLLAASFNASATSMRQLEEKGESGDGGLGLVYE